ncbi:GNAT family N-acetyltransferase [Cupriavidus alkaliphilus]|uniref:Ribosomal protein S18 acetylase RimI-like enzyme n=1 Tax=Cupriavidus alkaliphilus TaxID=942866 RepID=A0A7W4YTK7_9BURK|nr:GNAT family N-acetyltransferase [Cupriavidus alkaliphilus]MBB3009582.1 ribosomal protein S18 acetylase RimI-like enzyme [Cupriavidus alkaliphilus]
MFQVRLMTIDDYDRVIQLMKGTDGVSIRDADSRESTLRYLERNPGLSFIAELGGAIVGCIMAGHDGRRGYLQHLLVLPEHRRKGVANALVERCLLELEGLGIKKSHIDVLKTNSVASKFWARKGWKLRTDIDRYSIIRGDSENA